MLLKTEDLCGNNNLLVLVKINTLNFEVGFSLSDKAYCHLHLPLSLCGLEEWYLLSRPDFLEVVLFLQK